jgi:hypothetical protein
MAPPIFLGRFSGNSRSPVSVRNWVAQNVPCFDGPVPQEWTLAIYAKLRQAYVDTAVIAAGLELARKDGYVFNMPIYTVIKRGQSYSHKHRTNNGRIKREPKTSTQTCSGSA